jgi:hypothetical protein
MPIRPGLAYPATTVARWLRYWLTTRSGIRPTILRRYTERVERHLLPHLGRIHFAELTGRHVELHRLGRRP